MWFSAEARDEIRPALGLDRTFALSCHDDLGLRAALNAGFGIGYCQDGIGLAMHEDLRATRRIRALFDRPGEALTTCLAVL
ncbi:hypothetical protein [Methylobacterium sp. J-068]|uniref:hypothetical protein n=1 Tax=Methylobacterium sp. J-068 TaxID=2836649 RepID=UPI001FBAEF24|nr:hypothetical protein [Methylobacterium sp. J-068]MCJ2034794.1 hypothetical protein [Methylobacterium sp. J-068]